MEWRPAKDKPLLNQPVLAYCRDGSMIQALRIGDRWVTPKAGYVLEHVTHWMPLPDPPQATLSGGTQD